MTRQKYKKLNLLLDSDVSFTQQEIKEGLGLHILPNQLSTFKLLMVNFAEHREPLAFSVGNNQYPPHNFNIHDATYRTIQGVVKKLDEAKLAKFLKGKPQGRAEKAELSRLKPSKKLMNWVDEQFPYGDSIYLNPQTHVRLRNDKKKIISYQPTIYSKHVDQVMKHYHQKLIEWEYCLDGIPQDKLHMYCNFGYFDNDASGNPNIRYGGRWWGEHNQLASKERTRRITFDNAEGGTDLVELDFKSAILTALRYWELGREPEKDHYKLFRHDEYVDRQHLKNLTKLMLNRSRKRLKEAYEKRFYTTKEGKPKKNLTLEQKVELHWLYDTVGRFIAKNHYDIRHWFFRSKRGGQLASFVETNLMLEIVRRCCNENIPVITVYDSCIVPKIHQKRIYQLMYEEDILPFVKDLIDKDEQDSVERTLKGYLDWNSPVIKRRAKEAKENGLTLIDTSLYLRHFIYECNECGYEIDRTPDSIPTKKVRCPACYQKQLQDEANAMGFNILGEGKDKDYRLYGCMECGNEREYTVQKMRAKEVQCKACWFNDLVEAGKAKGIIVIGKGKRKNKNDQWYECKFIECGHTQEIQAKGILLKDSKNICWTCQEEKYAEEAKKVGWKLLGEAKEKHYAVIENYRHYECLICGHRQDIAKHGIRAEEVTCHGCEETAFDKPSKLYLLRMKHKDFTWLKLGHAKDVKKRIKQYGLVDGIKVETLIAIDFDTGREATKIEEHIGQKNKKYKYGKKKMKEYMTRSGFNECYKLEALDKLLEELESV